MKAITRGSNRMGHTRMLWERQRDARRTALRHAARRVIGRGGCTFGVTLIEALVSTVILSMVAAGAAMALTTGLGAQRDANLQLLAGLAAEQQVSLMMTAPYASVPNYGGTEVTGGMLAPPRFNASLTEIRDPMGPAFASLGRTTVVTAQTRGFPQYENVLLPGWRIQVTVMDAHGRVYASIDRFRVQELDP